MYNSRVSIGSRARDSHPFKTSLGNTAPRYNSEVTGQRRKFVVSSMRGSEDVPDWMARTQSHHFREHQRNRSLFTNAESPFKVVQQTYVYAKIAKPAHPEGQFQPLQRPRTRTAWEMKNHTFEFEWPARHAPPRAASQLDPRPQEPARTTMYEAAFRPASRNNEIMRFALPKYAYKESPLHVQKETPIKIGHPMTLNSTQVK